MNIINNILMFFHIYIYLIFQGMEGLFKVFNYSCVSIYFALQFFNLIYFNVLLLGGNMMVIFST